MYADACVHERWNAARDDEPNRIYSSLLWQTPAIMFFFGCKLYSTLVIILNQVGCKSE